MAAERHMEDEDIEKYSMHEMAAVESVPFEEHLLSCETCRNRVLETEIFVSAMYRAGTQIRSASQKRSLWSWTLATSSAAAVVLMAALLTGMPFHSELEEVHLYAMRGGDMGAKVNPQRPLLLVPDRTGLPIFPSYYLQIVDQYGKPVISAAAQGERPALKVSGIPYGIYFVRLLSPAGELLREYGLESAR